MSCSGVVFRTTPLYICVCQISVLLLARESVVVCSLQVCIYLLRVCSSIYIGWQTICGYVGGASPKTCAHTHTHTHQVRTAYGSPNRCLVATGHSCAASSY